MKSTSDALYSFSPVVRFGTSEHRTRSAIQEITLQKDWHLTGFLIDGYSVTRLFNTFFPRPL